MDEYDPTKHFYFQVIASLTFLLFMGTLLYGSLRLVHLI
jgi:hypothetical protein